MNTMTHTFIGKIIKQGNRHFIAVPFNVWETCGQKGNVQVQVTIDNCVFECKLVPKGKGFYYIPITKSILTAINGETNVDVSFRIITGLTRIRQNSPYTKENPIQTMKTIQKIAYPKAGYCGQQCIAMLTGLRVEDIVEIMHAKAWQCSFSKLLETLDYFGISYEDKVMYTRGKPVELPKCCIVTIRDERINHFALYYKGEFYEDTTYEASDIISYLKINVE